MEHIENIHHKLIAFATFRIISPQVRDFTGKENVLTKIYQTN